jgi:hypothetical protein
LGQLAYDKGIRVLTASQADDVALEHDRLEHGLLTHALLIDGVLSARADFQPRDRRIELVEWLSYGAQRVPELYSEITTGNRPLTSEGDRGAERRAAMRQRRPPQQPALFDFVARPRPLTIVELR